MNDTRTAPREVAAAGSPKTPWTPGSAVATTATTTEDTMATKQEHEQNQTAVSELMNRLGVEEFLACVRDEFLANESAANTNEDENAAGIWITLADHIYAARVISVGLS
jgi:hypothetical protein